MSSWELLVGREAFDSLSTELQQILRSACYTENSFVLAEFNTRNHEALKTLVEEHGVELRRFPDDVLEALEAYSIEVLDELAADDETVARVYESYQRFRAEIDPWLEISTPSNAPTGTLPRTDI